MVVANVELLGMVSNNVLATSFDDASLDDAAFVVHNSIAVQKIEVVALLAYDAKALPVDRDAHVQTSQMMMIQVLLLILAFANVVVPFVPYQSFALTMVLDSAP